MAFIPHPKPKPITVKSLVDLEDYTGSGIYTAGHRFLVVKKINEDGLTHLQDDETTGYQRSVMARRHQFRIIGE